MRRDGDHVCFSQARLLGDIATDASEPRARRDDLREEARRNIEALEQIDGPTAAQGVEALRRRGVRELGTAGAAEPVVHEVGHEEERLCDLERGVALRGHGAELEDGVDRHQLDAGALVQVASRNLRLTASRRCRRGSRASRVAGSNGPDVF